MAARFVSICTFRRQNAALLDKAFSTVLELAARVGVMKLGQVTVAIDGTKVLANASKHAVASYEKADPPTPTPQASLLAACRPGLPAFLSGFPTHQNVRNPSPTSC
jgi:hypothetical protein